MRVDFSTIINKSISIAWRYKTLWIFGLFAGGGSGFNFDPDDFIGSDFNRNDWNNTDLGNFFDNLPFHFTEQLAIGIVAALVAVMLVFMVCHFIANPALIDAVNKITRGGKYRFGDSFSRGLDLFWRFVGLTIIVVIIVIAVIAFVTLLAIVLTPFTLILTIPVVIVLAFITFHTFALAEVAIVARNGMIMDSINEGFLLFKQNIGNCLILTFIYIGLFIGIGILLVLITLFAFLPVNLLVGFLTGEVVLTLILGLILALPVSLVVGGIIGTFSSSLYTQFYFALVDPESTAKPLPPKHQIPPSEPVPEG